MARSHQQQHMQRRVMIIGLSTLALVIFMATFGLHFLINASIVVGNAISGDRNKPTDKKDVFFGTLFVDEPPAATNSAEIFISGSTSNFDRLLFYIKDEEVKEIKLLNEDSFSEKIGNLKEGKNEITLKARSSKTKESKESDPFIIRYKKNKPKLEISEPAKDSTVHSQEVTIKGSTDPEVSIEIDGAPVVVTAQGSFQTSVRLKEGDNTLQIIAVDEAGNEEKIEYKLKYEKED